MTMLLIPDHIDLQRTILLTLNTHHLIQSLMSKSTTVPSTDGRGRIILLIQHIMTVDGTQFILESKKIIASVTLAAITTENIHRLHILSILVQLITLLDAHTHLSQDQDLFVILEIDRQQVERTHIIQNGISLVTALIEIHDQNTQVGDRLMNLMIGIGRWIHGIIPDP